MRAPYSSKEHCIGQVIRERMVKLDFKEEFIKKILKEYSMKKIEEKLDLLMERKNIQSPAGWLRAALKNDYPTPHPHLNPPLSRGRKFGDYPPPQREKKFNEYLEEESRPVRMDSRLLGNDIKKSESEDKKILSREEALGWIREIRRGLGANG